MVKKRSTLFCRIFSGLDPAFRDFSFYISDPGKSVKNRTPWTTLPGGEGNGQFVETDNPCPPNGVVCWVSRAMEKETDFEPISDFSKNFTKILPKSEFRPKSPKKTIFLRFMFVMTIVSIVLTVVELHQLFSKKVLRYGISTMKKLGCSNQNDEMTNRRCFFRMYQTFARFLLAKIIGHFGLILKALN